MTNSGLNMTASRTMIFFDHLRTLDDLKTLDYGKAFESLSIKRSMSMGRMNKTYTTCRLILGDQLNAEHSWYREMHPDTLYVIAELKQEATYATHHIQKIQSFFAAMAAFAQALTQAGHQVLHLTLDDTESFKSLAALMDSIIERYQIQHFHYQQPDEFRLDQQLITISESLTERGVSCRCVETEHFYLAHHELTRYFKPDTAHRMEAFYRKMRVQFQILMDASEPEGGQWNFDADNRHKLKKTDLTSIPEPLLFANDVADINRRLHNHQITTLGDGDDQLLWPITRQQGKALLQYFCRHLLPHFGRFQDAMTCQADDMYVRKQWSLYHSRLSFCLNAKILSPHFVVETAIAHYRQNREMITLAQLEGFVRQILGWREFVRGIYWLNMPSYATQNQLNAHRALPRWFWTGDTKMNCLQYAIKQSLGFGYAHHIQRLMVTGNFCLIAGIDPDCVDQWYLGIYVDAIEWVELPNTRGMSQFADGGIVASKAYAASGNYINKMSDYCSSCHYKVKEKVGTAACPLNSLYWQFMLKHQSNFGANPRQAMVYRTWNKQSDAQKEAILERADWCLQHLDSL